MDADDPREALTDAVDRELRALVSVDPSPQFLARVRTRIADEPPPAAPWFSWKLAGSIAAVAAAVVVVMLARWSSHDAAPRQPAPLLVATALPDTSTTIAGLERRAVVREPRTVPAAASHPESAPAAPAEVLIDAREAAALRALIAGVRAGRVDLAPILNTAAPTVMDLPPVSEIAIQPIAIDPLEQGVRQ